MAASRVLVLGGGDVGSAVAHRLFRMGHQVLISERTRSAHARRGMAFTDALFEGSAVLDGVEGRLQADVAGIEAQWRSASAIPVVTIPESQIMAALRFDVIIDATMKRAQVPPDMRSLAGFSIGLGPGYAPGVNCHVAIETQWGPTMGSVLVNQPTANRSGGPKDLDGVTRERFAVAPAAGMWRTSAQLGQRVNAGDVLGRLGELAINAPISGHLRGLAWDGVQVPGGQRLAEIDPRASPEIFGLGERPLAIADGVARALVGVTAGAQ